METPYDDSTFRNQIDLGVRVSGKKVINRDDDQMMRKHRKEHFFTVRVDNLSFDATPDILAAMGVTSGDFLEGLSNATTAPIVVETPEHTPKVARIYELDQICRHAPSLQASPLMKREELSHG